MSQSEAAPRRVSPCETGTYEAPSLKINLILFVRYTLKTRLYIYERHPHRHARVRNPLCRLPNRVNKSQKVLATPPQTCYNIHMNDTDSNMTRCDYCLARVPFSHLSDDIIAPWMVLCHPCAVRLLTLKANA